MLVPCWSWDSLLPTNAVIIYSGPHLRVDPHKIDEDFLIRQGAWVALEFVAISNHNNVCEFDEIRYGFPKQTGNVRQALSQIIPVAPGQARQANVRIVNR